jgi:hypothetical protein
MIHEFDADLKKRININLTRIKSENILIN